MRTRVVPDMNDIDVRARGQLPPIVVIVVVVLFTLTSAGANLIPSHRPTPAQLRAEEMTAVIEQRRERMRNRRAEEKDCGGLAFEG